MSPVWFIPSAPSLPRPAAFGLILYSSVALFSVLSLPGLLVLFSSIVSLPWRLVSSAGVSSPLTSPGSPGNFSLSSWPLLAFLLFALSLRFPSSACYPLMVIVDPISLLRCWLSSLGASLPGISLSCCDSLR